MSNVNSLSAALHFCRASRMQYEVYGAKYDVRNLNKYLGAVVDEFPDSVEAFDALALPHCPGAADDMHQLLVDVESVLVEVK